MSKNYFCQIKLLCSNKSTFLNPLIRKYKLERSNVLLKNEFSSNKITAYKYRKVKSLRRYSGTIDNDKNKKSEDVAPDIDKPDDFLSTLGVWSISGISAYLASFSLGSAAYGFAAIPISLFHYEALKDILSTTNKNLTLTQKYVKARVRNYNLEFDNTSVGECFDKIAYKYNREIMIQFENIKWTYKQAEMLTNKITNYFLSRKFEKGDVVGILVTNRPEYITLLLGLAKIGIVSAVIDVKLKKESLVNAIQASDCSAIIVSEDIISEILKIRNRLNPKIELLQLGGNYSVENFTDLSNKIIASSYQTPEIIHKVNHDDLLMQIYTCDNKKAPKTTTVSHAKFLYHSIGITSLLSLNLYDTIYNPMQLDTYAGIFGTGPAVVCGIPVVLCRKFKPSHFWSDCIKYNCTVAQLYGKTCQRLLLEPENKNDKQHNIKKMFGHNVNGTLWKDFSNRFVKDDKEQNHNIVNMNKKDSMKSIIEMHLTEYMYRITNNDGDDDVEIVTPLLNVDARNSMQDLVEPNMTIPNMISQIPQNTRRNLFNFQATETLECERTVTKIPSPLEVLGKTEDVYFWRDKTIITKEVESIIKIMLGHQYCIVYGVPVAGVNGKLGMACLIDLDKKVDLVEFSQKIVKYIPDYARPIILRIISESHDMSSFKYKKLFYAIDGFDPKNINDKLYYLNTNSENGRYELLTNEIYKSIINNKIVF